MQYSQFRESAYRHLIVCKQMIKDVSERNIKGAVKNKIYQEVYYLSGYIVESLLSYSLCSFLKIDGDCMKSDPFTKDSKKFKTHDLQQKFRYASEKGCTGISDLCFLATPHHNNKIQELFNNWDVKYRYESANGLNDTLLSDYVKELEKMYNTIIIKYPL